MFNQISDEDSKYIWKIKTVKYAAIGHMNKLQDNRVPGF